MSNDSVPAGSVPTSRRHRRRTLWLAAGVAVAGIATTAGVAAAVAQEHPIRIHRLAVMDDGAAVVLGDRPGGRTDLELAAERAQIADWARRNHLTGLSPESLQPAPVAIGRDQIADWARRNHLTGLSPEWLQPAP
jgi:hypothetical protein